MSEDRYAGWDAAYVLGALSATDRQDFERHLQTCGECRASVAELAAMPGLLGRVDEDRAMSTLAPETAEAPPPELTARLFGTAGDEVAERRRTRVRRRLAVAGVGVAAAAVLGAAVIPRVVPDGSPSAPSVAMQQLHQSALTAQVQLTQKKWGTSVRMSCRYRDSAYPGGVRTYALDVVDAQGNRSQVSTWRAGPGDLSDLTAATALQPGQIKTVQVRDAASGTLLLTMNGSAS
ncbi:zf-HC2 domain-containing protein [Flexivirga sp. ID2601S]|uniref:Zf-HC2 domain-containing protein n=1 Tax=Flexivirga aerilata TaxID=1656889 RepID=A0A849AJS0_9MICO|nr:zf-HC2 domain-containing protein [Flexivirga aerilata]NNG38640.1 zf-HC2 domain-containing protein [Flexivirga aerilata]